MCDTTGGRCRNDLACEDVGTDLACSQELDCSFHRCRCEPGSSEDLEPFDHHLVADEAGDVDEVLQAGEQHGSLMANQLE